MVWVASGLMAHALSAAPLQQGRITQVIRDVKILSEQTAARPAAVNDEVVAGTAVRTGVESRTELTFADLTIARLGANTIFTFDQGSRTIDLGGGAVLVRVPKNSGGAKVNTAAVTAAITGTTMLAEYHANEIYKFVMLEGTATICRLGGECVNIGPGQMLSGVPGEPLGEPVTVDLKALVETSQLLEGFGPLGSEDLIRQEIQNQQNAGNAPLMLAYNQTASEQLNAIDQRLTASEATPTPSPLPSPSPSVTPGPSPSPSASPLPSPSVSPSPSPSPSVSPTPSPSPSVSPTPQPTPQKFGTPPVITSANLSTIDAGTVIQTDPTITRNGETGEGRIYRAPATDGPRSMWLFGSTSTFDMQLNVDSGDPTFLNFAAFKFADVILAGNPIIDTANGGASVLALIGENSLTSAGPGSILTFGGVNALLLATQNGSITLGPELSINGPAHVIIYARGAGSNLTLGAAITADELELAAEGNLQINGAQTARVFSALAGGNFLAGSGLIQASEEIQIRANGNLNFDVNQFAPGANIGFALELSAGSALNLSVDGDRAIFAQAGSVLILGSTINLLGTAGTLIDLDNGTPISLNAGLGGIQGANVGFHGGNLHLVSDGDINIFSATIPAVNNSRPIQGMIIAAGSFTAVQDVETSFLQAGTSVQVGGDLDFGFTLNAGTTMDVGGQLRGDAVDGGRQYHRERSGGPDDRGAELGPDRGQRWHRAHPL